MSPSGESKGFAHIDLSDIAAAEAAMKASAENQFFLNGRGLYLDYAGPPSSKPAFPPSSTLHFSGYSGDEDGLQLALEEFAPSITNLRISKLYFSSLFHVSWFLKCETHKLGKAIVSVSLNSKHKRMPLPFWRSSITRRLRTENLSRYRMPVEKGKILHFPDMLIRAGTVMDSAREGVMDLTIDLNRPTVGGADLLDLQVTGRINMSTCQPRLEIGLG